MIDIHYKPGLRAIKSMICVFICLAAGVLLGRDDMFYACIASVISTQQNYQQTKKTGANRLVGTFIGGIFGLLILELMLEFFADLPWVSVLVITAVTLLLIYICNLLGIKGASHFSVIVFLSIVATADRGITDTFEYVVFRMAQTALGILVAILVNRLIRGEKEIPPKADSKTS